MADISCDILDTLVEFPAEGKWHKELNLVKWGQNQPKYDLRPWNGDRSQMGKGVTMTREELTYLKEALSTTNL